MKKWVFAWIVFTLYLVVNMTVMRSAEQPHLVATLLLGFFFFLIFGLRGVYGAMTAVATIVLLAVIVHQLRHQGQGHATFNYFDILYRLFLDCITIMGGGGLAYWVQRILFHRHIAK